MYHYGIDLHSDNFYAARLHDDEEKYDMFKYPLTEKGIQDFNNVLTKDDRVAFEASCNSFWFYDQLKEHVKECVVVDPRKFKIVYMSPKKTDKTDSQKIARYLKIDHLPSVYVPDQTIRKLRRLYSSYGLQNKMKVMVKNHIHCLFKMEGMKLKKSDIDSNLLDSEAYQSIPELCKLQVSIFLEQLSCINTLQEKIVNEIYLLGEKYLEEIKILTSEPGISVKMALGIISDIADINRFPNAKHLTSYLGCVPRVDQSNQRNHTGRIHKEARTLTRTLMSQSTHHFYKSSDAMHEWYLKKKAGKGAGKARIAVIRRKIVGLYYMLTRKQWSKYRKASNHNFKMNDYYKKLEELKKRG